MIEIVNHMSQKLQDTIPHLANDEMMQTFILDLHLDPFGLNDIDQGVKESIEWCPRIMTGRVLFEIEKS